MRKRKERGGDMDDWISTNHAQKHLNINFLFSFFSTVNNKLKLKRIFCRVTLIWPIHAVHANLWQTGDEDQGGYNLGNHKLCFLIIYQLQLWFSSFLYPFFFNCWLIVLGNPPLLVLNPPNIRH